LVHLRLLHVVMRIYGVVGQHALNLLLVKDAGVVWQNQMRLSDENSTHIAGCGFDVDESVECCIPVLCYLVLVAPHSTPCIINVLITSQTPN